MEAYFILQGIVEVVIVIKNISYQVKANKKQCQRLVDRIYAIIAPLQTLENHELTRLNIQQLFDRQQDEQDQETDLADINTKLDDITTLLTKQQEMQLQLPMHVDEMLNRRFKSLKRSFILDVS
ncbi:unnamed protein product [Didymodactylos carnosus]|uniref:Mixed lineage kinase domain-containing protein n=1 Tax=Didymodactylos carnosus TaxID=1234261 RepID=A0A8S2J9B1_9BILA|nr:unnamed protein product [Didymodactylos carnosus]CAF3799844.1 unnamed protein product [Didymodactylos carnosus]